MRNKIDRNSLDHPDRLIDDRGKFYNRNWKKVKHVHIQTKLPHPDDLKLLESLNQYEAHSMQGQIPLVWDKAKDYIVFDRHGNKFIDFTSGICVTNVGHGNYEVMDAIRHQIDNPLAHAYTFGTEIRYNFIKKLVETCYPKGKAFLVSAGTEATEVACKLMRIYTKKKIIFSISGCMHGRTMLAEQLKGDYTWADDTFNVRHLKVPNENTSFTRDMNRYLFPEKIAGFIIESYQGWSAGFYPKKWIQDLMIWAKKRNIPVCFDEIQGGFGRTGKMFACEHYEIERPDLICFGKGVSSSVPLSGVIGKKEIIDSVPIGSMSSTHSANPIACAAGLANLEYILEQDLPQRARIYGEAMIKKLKSFGLNIQGKGMLCAILTNEKEADRIVMECFKRGLLLIRTHRDSVKIAPPLTIDESAIEEGLNIIKKVVRKK